MLNRKVTIGVSVPVMALALSATASFANSNEGTVTADALKGKGRQMQDSGFYSGSCLWDSFYRGLLCRGRSGASSHLCD